MSQDLIFITINELTEIGELSPLPMVVLNREEVIYSNPEFKKMTGYDTLSLVEMDSKDYHTCLSVLREMIVQKNGESERKEYNICTATGRSLWMDYKYKIVLCGSTVYWLLLLFDVSEKKKNEIHLSKLLSIREAMLDVTHAVVQAGNIKSFYEFILERAIVSIPSAQRGSILLAKGDLLFVASQFGFEDEGIYKFELPIRASFLYQMTQGEMNSVVRVDDVFALENYHRIDKSEGENAYIRSTISAPIYIDKTFYGIFSVDACRPYAFDGDDEKLMAFMSSHIEIAMANHILYEEKIFLSQYDSLTRLYNRNYFVSAFQDAKERGLRYGGNFALAVIDMDGLKGVNDEYGHLIGDEVLKKFADHMRDHLRKSDVFARYGGDEFVGLFYDVTRPELALRLNALKSKLETETIIVGESEIIIRFSFGISVFAEEGQELDVLFKIADTRMYRYKSKSKKR